MTPSDRTLSHGVRCDGCRVVHQWRDLDVAIISNGEWGLVWLWACGGTVLRMEPFAFPADMPGIQEPSEAKNAADVPTRGLRGF